jgi:UDP:flavonoid glycosyltransferase YjiC (YdhE family)
VLRPVVESQGLLPLPVIPPLDAILAEVKARTGADPMPGAGAALLAEFFAGVPIDLAADKALAAAREFRPDLAVRETCDHIGPFVAAARDVPMATLTFGPAWPPAAYAAFDATAEPRFAARDLSAPPSTWYLDTWPQSLQTKGWLRPDCWQPLRPEPHRDPGALPPAPIPERSARPRLLITFGTYFNAPEVITPLLHDLVTLDIDIVVALGLRVDARQFDVDPGRVSFVPFTPFAGLLDEVDAVLTHGGAGTTLAALANGIPLVITPQGADHFTNAERVAVAGAGIALQPGEASPKAVTAAVRRVLTEASVRQTAAAVGEEIASMPAAHEVAALLEAGLG